MIEKTIYPYCINEKIVPDIHIEVFIEINVLLGGVTKGYIIFYYYGNLSVFSNFIIIYRMLCLFQSSLLH